MILDKIFGDGIRIVDENLSRNGVSNELIIGHEIETFFASPEYKAMDDGVRYYEGRHDIEKKKREMIDGTRNADGSTRKVEVNYLPNSRVTDNQYRKMVKQKTNYLVGKPLTVQTENDSLADILTKDYFNRHFARTLKRITTNALNCGIAWLYCYYDKNGEFRFRTFDSTEICPLWTDSDHTELEGVIRVYDVIVYDGRKEQKIWKVEYYTTDGIEYYEYIGGHAKKVEPFFEPYFRDGEGQGFAWEKIPFVAFKYNPEEKPLIVNCKSLQDGLNTILSNFQDNMEEDMRNTILVLMNYEGTDLGEFRRNLMATGAVKVRSVEGVAGGIQPLTIEVNAANYQLILNIFKKQIIENCMGYDAKDERLAGAANQMNIISMYNDIDLDAKDMETEFQVSLEELMYFINTHLSYTGQGDFSSEQVDFIFDTDMPMDESITIANIKNSVGLLSNETLVSMHPYVTDVQEELDRIADERKQQLEEIDQYQNAFPEPLGDEGDQGADM